MMRTIKKLTGEYDHCFNMADIEAAYHATTEYGRFIRIYKDREYSGANIMFEDQIGSNHPRVQVAMNSTGVCELIRSLNRLTKIPDRLSSTTIWDSTKNGELTVTITRDPSAEPEETSKIIPEYTIKLVLEKRDRSQKECTIRVWQEVIDHALQFLIRNHCPNGYTCED